MGKKEDIDTGRRSALTAAAALPLLALGLGSRGEAAGTPAPCYDANAFTAGQKAQRAGIKFRKSTDPAKRCGVCMYFSGTPTACGKCQLLLNGPVSNDDVCDGWTKKAS